MKKYIIPAAVALFPFVALAQTGAEGLLTKLQRLIDIATPIVFALAFLAFFWGLLRYIFAKGNPEAKSGGKDVMIWAVIALFLMVSVFGVIRLLQETFGIRSSENITLPRVPR